MNDAEILTESKRFREQIVRITKSHDGCICDFCNIETLLPKLIDLVEKYGTMLIEERSNHLQGGYLSHLKSVNEQSCWKKRAQQELGLEANQWHKIGEDEKAAIELAITELISRENLTLAFCSGNNHPLKKEVATYREVVTVLRRLIEES